MSTKKKFSKIYHQQVNNIYRFVYLKIDSPEITEDLTAEVFREFWKIFKKGLDPNSNQKKIKNEKAFLYHLARYKVADYYRAQPDNKQNLNNDIEIEDQESDLEEQQHTELQKQRLHQALRKIHDNYQDLIIMFYINDLSVREIADSLEKSEGAVKTGLHRAREALKEELSSEEEG